MRFTQKQKQSLAQRKKANANLTDYCNRVMYLTDLTEAQTAALQFLLDNPKEKLKHVFIYNDTVYVINPQREMWNKTQLHGWSLYDPNNTPRYVLVQRKNHPKTHNLDK